ncbi:MAG: dTDP-4-dehydrorhamnose reductase [Rickettsiales bacterium]|nr:dTDP-4-dehydrorhamnose reductase [Pseudomonadota bacterium]MDA0966806.1 dTDP-4-dehydrorhamnose reductase [Pseudomonadota bacterium]MDG4543478.1 dTDP-4-dehydrorhamnose reductase [Rickettsiales bacterium]MDG4546128.1 dTDP-4-dehydrorhamnose reductase [Rickettsiales bacterium]MDG4547601.1 dTDP-4-dehydrorhamnose reductase [Rickettsiales bacterium]
MNKKYIIIGKNGQVGSNLVRLLGNNAISYSHSDCDFKNLTQVTNLLKETDIKAIFNACAYTNVDAAETEYDEAIAANCEIPDTLAKFCKEKDIPLVHYSTDYVYSGDGTAPNKEEDAPSPLNKYGQSKLDGEKRIIASGCKYLIFRTSWVYDLHGKNFLTTMLRLAKEREGLSIVSDQVGSPTYALDLAEKSIEAFENALKKDSFPSGVYNLCNSGETNWHEFAENIFDNAKKHGIALKIKEVKKITACEYPTPAKRPLNSRLDCSKAKSVLNTQMPDWKDSLEKCMEKLIENTNNTDKRPVSC